MEKINVEKSTVFANNTEDLKVAAFECLNKDGYFSHLQDFSQYRQGNLEAVTITSSTEHPYRNRHDNLNEYEYFIPKDKVVFEGEPKRYRPYKGIAELPFVIGNIIRYRKKHSCNEYKGMVIAIEHQKDYPYDVENIIIGGVSVTPQELFDNYELLDKDSQYKPFGFEPFGIEE